MGTQPVDPQGLDDGDSAKHPGTSEPLDDPATSDDSDEMGINDDDDIDATLVGKPVEPAQGDEAPAAASPASPPDTR